MAKVRHSWFRRRLFAVDGSVMHRVQAGPGCLLPTLGGAYAMRCLPITGTLPRGVSFGPWCLQPRQYSRANGHFRPQCLRRRGCAKTLPTPRPAKPYQNPPPNIPHPFFKKEPELDTTQKLLLLWMLSGPFCPAHKPSVPPRRGRKAAERAWPPTPSLSFQIGSREGELPLDGSRLGWEKAGEATQDPDFSWGDL